MAEKRNRQKNYLKHFGLIRRYVQTKYNLTISDLEVLMFMNSEPAFTMYQLKDINALTGITMPKMKRLQRLGFVDFIQDPEMPGHHKRVSRLFSISSKGRAAINLLYDKLDGGYVSICANNNPIFRKGAPESQQRLAKNIMMLRRKQMRSSDTGEQRQLPE